MRICRIVSVSLLAMLGAFQLAGCASSPDQRATGQVIDDSAITARVKTALATDVGAGTVGGVQSVRDDLRVTPPRR